MRELGPINPQAPAFPLAGGVLLPLKAKSAADSGDFINLWAGQGFPLSPGPSSRITRLTMPRAGRPVNRLVSAVSLEPASRKAR